ncbi:SOS response-associated peptidase [Subtercola sp. PAMC28395]|uniref:SOS response-associated peptidase family protein n=1 Tax=Subtercola sp. PAMC28395 TaxID=2846775 RepID=UPI001C0D9D29|nr:SOS response-associated peptidase family protein [Subtercola sp. PAMC28395]QWT24227.1 SOS response-associated peptidase [Subtercola sp. PAMC28395]
MTARQLDDRHELDSDARPWAGRPRPLRFALSASSSDIETFIRGSLGHPGPWRPSYVFDHGATVLIARASAGALGSQELVPASWGYLPLWNNGELAPVTSVGIERIGMNGLFRDTLRDRRCLIPLTGYFDWKDEPGASEPFFVSGNAPMMASLGVYNVSAAKPRERLSVAFITRDETVDARRRTAPMILGRGDWSAWLDPGADARSPSFLQELKRRAIEKAEKLTMHRVSDRINLVNPRNSASLIAPR